MGAADYDLNGVPDLAWQYAAAQPASITARPIERNAKRMELAGARRIPGLDRNDFITGLTSGADPADGSGHEFSSDRRNRSKRSLGFAIVRIKIVDIGGSSVECGPEGKGKAHVCRYVSRTVVPSSSRARHNLPMRCSWLIVLCCSAVAAFGQELRVSAEHRNPDQITIEIALEAPPGKAPVALQWESSFAAQQLAMEGKGPVAAKEATEAGKILTCSGGWKKPSETYAYRCILVGGQKPIANGPIATISFKPAVKGPHGTASVTVENVQGVTADLKKMALKDTATTIAIGKAK